MSTREFIAKQKAFAQEIASKTRPKTQLNDEEIVMKMMRQSNSQLMHASQFAQSLRDGTIEEELAVHELTQLAEKRKQERSTKL